MQQFPQKAIYFMLTMLKIMPIILQIVGAQVRFSQNRNVKSDYMSRGVSHKMSKCITKASGSYIVEGVIL